TSANSASAACRSSTISCAITSGGGRVLHVLQGLVPDVLRALPLDARQRLALLLRLDHAGGRTADEQEVVGVAVRRLQAELAHRDASCRREVDGTRVLDRPARRREHAVDLDPGLRLGRQVCDSTVTHRANLPRRGDTRRSAGYAKTLTSRYSVSRWTGILPNERMRWTSSSVVVRCVVPAAETTFSSIITERMSSTRSSSVSTCPYIIVAVVDIPSRCAWRMTSSHSSVRVFFGAMIFRTRSTRISAPPPGSESRPASRRRESVSGIVSLERLE